MAAMEIRRPPGAPLRPLPTFASALTALCAVVGGCTATGGEADQNLVIRPTEPSEGTPDEGSAGSGPVEPGRPGDGEGGPDFGLMDPDEDELDGCNELALEFEKVIPTVGVLVDRSQSMFVSNGQVTRNTLWDPLFQALTDPVIGVIPALQQDVRCGLAAYNLDASLGAAACPNQESVPIALDNAEAFASTYARAGVEPQAH
jgi:hypothetical protein